MEKAHAVHTMTFTIRVRRFTNGPAAGALRATAFRKGLSNVRWHLFIAASGLAAFSALAAAAGGGVVPDDAATAAVPAAAWNLHGQFTGVFQYHPAFTSPYQGSNSLDRGNNGRETTDATLFGGARLWAGAAAYVNAEVDQGFGLNDTLGAAGFPSGEAYKVGARNPYFRLPRAFVRQVIALSDDPAAPALDDAINQLPDAGTGDSLTLTAGKFSTVDIFDSNRYAHDPRGDFLNWSVIDAGAFDYPADAWGFTYGAAIEWRRAWWTARGGIFALSKVPNSKDIDGQFRQFGLISEFEARYALLGRPGTLRALAFLNRGEMGRYADALALAQTSGAAPDTGLVRRYASRPGMVLNAEQEIAPDLGAFGRLSANTGAQEAYEFTEINASASAGLSLGGSRWQRPDDRTGLAVVMNGISSAARRYLADGGLGILIGDGRLPHYGREKIVEAYYACRVRAKVTAGADLQELVNPAYNRDRGPVTVASVRIHAEF
jgi:high affinity Mn2+ porin